MQQMWRWEIFSLLYIVSQDGSFLEHCMLLRQRQRGSNYGPPRIFILGGTSLDNRWEDVVVATADYDLTVIHQSHWENSTVLFFLLLPPIITHQSKPNIISTTIRTWRPLSDNQTQEWRLKKINSNISYTITTHNWKHSNFLSETIVHNIMNTPPHGWRWSTSTNHRDNPHRRLLHRLHLRKIHAIHVALSTSNTRESQEPLSQMTSITSPQSSQSLTLLFPAHSLHTLQQAASGYRVASLRAYATAISVVTHWYLS